MFKAATIVTAVLAVATVLLPSSGRASLSIDPAFVELSLEKGRPSEVITVTNVTQQEMRYRVRAVHFVYTRGGNFEEIEPDDKSLALWTKFNPKEFTLAPKGSQAIRLTIVPPGNLKDGEYWAALRFEPLVGIPASGDDGEGRSVALEVRTNILVPVVGHIGKVTAVCELKDLQAWRTDDGLAVLAYVANIGNGRVRVKGFYEVLDPSGAVVADGLIGEDTMLSGGERLTARAVEGDFPEGEYTVRVRYESEKLEKPLAGQTRVRDEAPAGYAGESP